MDRLRKRNFSCLVSTALIASLVFYSGGCATMFRGTTQTVTVRTTPPGRAVMYQGLRVADGDAVTVIKHFQASRFNVDDGSGLLLVEMNYDPDPWLIADAALLLVFVIPGLVALGVDFGTGAWRKLHNPQLVVVPGAK